MAHEAAELVKALAWPIAVLLSLTMLRHPISDFLRDISKRVTKLSIFKVEIELAKLNAIRALPGPLLMPLQKGVFRPDAPTVDANANILNMETMPIVTTGIIRVSMADYVIIDVGEGDEWLTSRLYLLAALLERSLVRAIVFTTKGDFVGMANPHDVRSMLGIAFTEYERAFLRACGDAGDLPMSEFRHSGWSEPVISMIIGGFVGHDDIAVATPPAVMVRWTGWDNIRWELGEWLTAEGLRLLLRDKLILSSVAASFGTKPKEEATRGIIRQNGAFVALVSDTGRFEDLCDRCFILDTITRDLASQIAE